jgi:nitrate/nitrite transporter NarK
MKPLSILLFSALYLPAASPPRDTPKTGMDPERLAKIPSRMKSFVDKGTIAGCVTLISRHGAIASIEALGAPFFSLVSSFLKNTGAAGGIGLISATGQLGAFFGSSIMGLLSERTGGYAVGLLVFAAGITLPAVIVLLLGRRIAPRVEMAQAQTNAT